MLATEEPTVVLANNGGYPWHETCLEAVCGAKDAGIPRIVLAVHSTPEPVEGKATRRTDAEVALATDAIVVGAPELRRIFARERPVLVEKLKIIPYGVDDPGPPFPRPVSSKLRLGIASELRNPRKGHLVLLEALLSLRLSVGTWELRIAGAGPWAGELKKLAEETHLPVRFLGQLLPSEMADFYCSLDIYVLPSLQEGLSLTVLEAMSHGLPVIATDVGGHRDALIDGETGWLVPPENSAALAKRLRILVHSESLRRKLGREGRRRYQQSFTLSQSLDKWVELLNTGEASP